MSKKQALKILSLLTVLGGFALFTKTSLAKEITVTCYKDGKCEMEPSAGDALFDKNEADNTNMLPGDFIYRTLHLINKTNDTCAMYLKEIRNVRLGATTLKEFPSKMWTALETSHGIAFGQIIGGYPTNSASLQDLFDVKDFGITKVPAFSEEKVNWLVKFDPATGNPYQRAEVWFDFDMVFECQAISMKSFTISKDNTSWPAELPLGSEVLYQLVVTTQHGPVQNVHVIDAPPESVHYIYGSWTAVSNIRGDLRANGKATAPSYHSPGIWGIGDMEEDETVTLTYRAIVDDTATSGIYKDLAWAYGYSAEKEERSLFDRVEASETQNEKILATSVDSGFEINGGIVTDTFVGTQILVDEPVEPDTKKVSIKTEEKEGEVLGATTQILPATGANIFVTAGLTVLAIIGSLIAVLPLLRKKAKARVFIPSIVFAVLALVTTKKAYAQESLVLRVSEPRTPDNQAFIVDYVVLDLDNNFVAVTCEKKNPADTFFTLLSNTTTQAGGDSGICAINKSDFDDNGVYAIKVTAQAGGVTKSEEVAVTYKTSGPKKPEYIKKDKVDSCEYKIKVKTSGDTDTAYIEIYRSDKKDFTVGAGTRVKTVDIGENEVYEFTHKLYGGDCGSSYYAVRAFDVAGNPSDVRAEVVEKIVTGEGGSEEVVTEEGILLGTVAGGVSEGGANVAGESEVVLEEGENQNEKTEGEEGIGITEETPKVLGAETQKPSSWILPVALVAVIAYFVVKSKRGKSKSQ
jgi:hypothetical protein